jgi:two-component system chemotaxis response regulator CheY
MPNMSGLDFVKNLRSLDHGKNVPILMVTTRSVREDIVAAAQAGVNNYVVKPFTPQVLKEKIDAVFAALPGGN